MKVFFPASVFLIMVFCANFAFAQTEKNVEEILAENARLEKIWWKAGNLEKLINGYENALQVFRKQGNKTREAEMLYKMARNRRKLESEKSSKGKQNALEALQIYKSIGDAEGEISALAVLAWFEPMEISRNLFEEALAKARNAKNKIAEVRILHQYAIITSANSEIEKAFELLEAAMPLAIEIKNNEILGELHFGLGITFWRVGDYEKSLAHYEQAHKYYKEYGDFSWSTTSIENAALVYNIMEQPEKVLESYSEALPFRRENGHWTAVADNLTSIAQALVKLNQPQTALEKLSEALQIYEKSDNRYGIAWVWRVQGEANFVLQKYEKAIELFEKSRDLQGELNEQNGVAKAIYWLAKTEFARGNLAAAKRQAETALNLIENQLATLNKQDLRLSFFAARHDYYELYIEILQKLGETEQALEASEKSRAKNLFEILAGKSNPKVLSAKEIQNSLDADTALLEFSVGRNSSFVFVVTREKIAVYKLPKADEIELLVQDVRVALSEAGRRNYARFVTASRRLFEILLKPAENDLRTKKNLLIAPDASLNYLPFDVLLTEEPPRTGRADFQKLPYAVQNWAINYTPSASVLAEITNYELQITKTKDERPKADFIAFGDPIYGETDLIASNRVKRFVNEVFNSATLPRLSDSNREVSEIAANFGDSARIFLRGNATEENIKRNADLSSARIIHFATHGIINERQPLLSGLLLSQNSTATEDNFLQTEEIYALDLSADLVVLSACRTALGKNLRGEGVIGLTRAFLRSGSKSVISTLWQIEDVSTADLMIDFYKKLKTSPDKSTALREAKLKMLNNPRFAHPHFWSSFSLIGSR